MPAAAAGAGRFAEPASADALCFGSWPRLPTALLPAAAAAPPAGLAGLPLPAADSCTGLRVRAGLAGPAAFEARLRAVLGEAATYCMLRTLCGPAAPPWSRPSAPALLALPAACPSLDARPAAACCAFLSFIMSTGAQRDRGS